MLPRLKRLSGKEVVSLLGRFGFTALSQKGSHVKLRRTGSEGEKQTLVVPLHGEIDRGTLKAIFRQASQYIPKDQLAPLFYGE